MTKNIYFDKNIVNDNDINFSYAAFPEAVGKCVPSSLLDVSSENSRYHTFHEKHDVNALIPFRIRRFP